MRSSGVLQRVVLVRTDVSEERVASFITVTKFVELGTTVALTSNQSTLRRRCNIPEDNILHSHCSENLKSYIALTGCALQRRRNVSPVKYELSFYIPEDGILHSHRRGNLKPYIVLTGWTL
jgi:hypothetical protein